MLIAVFIWGGSFIATKLAIAEIPPIAFAVLRFAVAVAGLLAAHLVTRTPITIPRPLWGRVVLAGLLGTTATYVLENIALKYTTAGNTAIFIAASPLLTIAGAAIFLRERLNLRTIGGALLAFGGLAALVGASFKETGLGDGLMALNTLVGAWYALVSKTLADRASPLSTLTTTYSVGLVGLLPFAVGEAILTPATWHFSPLSLGSLAFLGLGSSGCAYWLWMYALGRMSAATSGVYLYLMPIVTLALSWLLLGEAMGPAKIAQAAIVLIGVYLASTARQAPRISEVPQPS